MPVALGVLEFEPLPLPLLPPLSVGEVVEEVEGEEEGEGVAGVGKKDTVAGMDGEMDTDGVPLVVELRDTDRVEVMVWVTEVGRENMQHAA